MRAALQIAGADAFVEGNLGSNLQPMPRRELSQRIVFDIVSDLVTDQHDPRYVQLTGEFVHALGGLHRPEVRFGNGEHGIDMSGRAAAQVFETCFHVYHHVVLFGWFFQKRSQYTTHGSVSAALSADAGMVNAAHDEQAHIRLHSGSVLLQYLRPANT